MATDTEWNPDMEDDDVQDANRAAEDDELTEDAPTEDVAAADPEDIVVG